MRKLTDWLLCVLSVVMLILLFVDFETKKDPFKNAVELKPYWFPATTGASVLLLAIQRS